MTTRIPRFHTEAEHHERDVPELWCVTLGLPQKSLEARVEAFQVYALCANALLNMEYPLLEIEGTAVDDERANPTCFLLRHAIELALKIALPQFEHELEKLLRDVEQLASDEGLPGPPAEFAELVDEWHRVDKAGEAFRYAAGPGVGAGVQCCVDPALLREDWGILNLAVENFILPVARAVEARRTAGP